MFFMEGVISVLSNNLVNAFKGVKLIFLHSSLQARQQGTKTQGVTKKEEKRRIEAKESDTSPTMYVCVQYLHLQLHICTCICDMF